MKEYHSYKNYWTKSDTEDKKIFRQSLLGEEEEKALQLSLQAGIRGCEDVEVCERKENKFTKP